MATTAACGSTGSVSLGGEITNWTVNLEIDEIEATSMASNSFKEYIGCLKSASGSFVTKIPCGVIGSHADVQFVNSKMTIEMDIIINDISTTTPVDGSVEFTYSFVSNGEVTIS